MPRSVPVQVLSVCLVSLAVAAPVAAQPGSAPPASYGDRQAGHFGDPGAGYFGNDSDGHFGNSALDEARAQARANSNRTERRRDNAPSPYVAVDPKAQPAATPPPATPRKPTGN